MIIIQAKFVLAKFTSFLHRHTSQEDDLVVALLASDPWRNKMSCLEIPNMDAVKPEWAARKSKVAATN